MRGIFRIGSSLLIGLTLVSVAFWVNQKSQTTTNSNGVFAASDAKQLRTYQVTGDTDGDGRSDWQEELEGTDPRVPDSAPTSTPTYNDLDEIFSELSNETDPDVAEPETFTDAFARSYIEQAVRSKYNESPASKDELVEDALASVENAVRYTTYSAGDLSIINDADASDMRTYGNELGAVLSTNVIPRDMNPYAVILQAQLDQDPELLQRLVVYVEAFAFLRDNVRAVSVPNTLVQEHLALLNTLSATHDVFVYLQNRMFDDPLLSFGYVITLMEKIDGMYPAVEAIEARFVANDIYYTKDEPGNKVFDF